MVKELNPKYAKIYAATGGLVQGEAAYRDFNRVEKSCFEQVNQRGKPTQPTTQVGELLLLSVRGKPIFDRVMQNVCATALKQARFNALWSSPFWSGGDGTETRRTLLSMTMPHVFTNAALPLLVSIRRRLVHRSSGPQRH